MNPFFNASVQPSGVIEVKWPNSLHHEQRGFGHKQGVGPSSKGALVLSKGLTPYAKGSCA